MHIGCSGYSPEQQKIITRNNLTAAEIDSLNSFKRIRKPVLNNLNIFI